MRRNWQPINLSNFAPNFAIFQPNLNLKAHSYLSAAGRLHMLADCGLNQGMNVIKGLLHPLEFVQLFQQICSDALVEKRIAQLTICLIVHLLNCGIVQLVLVEFDFCSV